MLSLTSFLIFVASSLSANQGVVAEEASPTYFGFLNIQPFFESLENMSTELIYMILKPFCKKHFVSEKFCPEEPCKDSKYRTIDGRCNNLKNPDWGTPNSIFTRLIPPNYADGVHAPPKSVTGEDLPSSRLLSYFLFPDKNVSDQEWTLATMQWGQTVAHDMSLSAATKQNGKEPTACCTELGSYHPNRDPNCYPIKISHDDPFYSQYNVTCMNFTRTATDHDAGLSLPDHPAQQITTVTSYLDASLVYGSDAELAARLREGKGGRMRVKYKNGRQFPPQAANPSDTCFVQSKDEPCYLSGDVRVNQNTELTALQILFLREHNRLATTLQHLNPHWDDEKLYQEARRIFIAENQRITYYEWLPIILGAENMKDLYYPEAKDFINDYDEHVNPSIINSFAAGAFRIFHSNIQGKLNLVQEDRQACKVVSLSDHYNKPLILEQEYNFDEFARGLSTQHQQAVDRYYTQEITQRFAKDEKLYGQDIQAISIQRGRDHGLPPYNKFRVLCGLPKAHKFEDFGDFITPEDIQKLKKAYNHPDDVEFLVGGSLEQIDKNALVGPSFLCVISKQFRSLRYGDRYFFESSSNPGAFTSEQLNEIRKTTMSRIICDNGDYIKSMQPSGFRVISEENSLALCDDKNAIPTIDLSLWKEENSTNQ